MSPLGKNKKKRRRGRERKKKGETDKEVQEKGQPKCLSKINRVSFIT